MAKIVLVEDDELMYKMYKYIFETSQHGLEIATDGEAGLKKIQETLPDLVLLDIMMPKLSGIEVLTKLKADPKTSQIPVVMLTNLADENIIKECMNKGALGYIVKSSVNPDQILTEVNKYLVPPASS